MSSSLSQQEIEEKIIDEGGEVEEEIRELKLTLQDFIEGECRRVIDFSISDSEIKDMLESVPDEKISSLDVDPDLRDIELLGLAIDLLKKKGCNPLPLFE